MTCVNQVLPVSHHPLIIALPIVLRIHPSVLLLAPHLEIIVLTHTCLSDVSQGESPVAFRLLRCA